MALHSLEATGVVGRGDACAASGQVGEKVARMLEESRRCAARVAEPRDPGAVPLTRLIGYVIDRHHVYARRQVAAVGVLLAEFNGAHENSHPGLARVRGIFENLRQELLFHMEKEEVSIFPRIIRAEAAAGHDDAQTPPSPSPVRDALRMLLREHDELCALLDEMRAATNDYSPPDACCESYGTLYRALSDLEMDLLQHVHLEDRLLFPRVLVTESRGRG
jgi:regulator of cell morphogenesis and NO signaling